MRVDVASRAPHASKHGATFAETWTNHDGTTIAAVGSVFSGSDRSTVSDLLRVAARALVGSRGMLYGALDGLDRVVLRHAAERRDDEHAAAVALLCFPSAEETFEFVGAGQLHVVLFDLVGTPGERLRGRYAALGTGVEHRDDETLFSAHRFHRDEVVVAATGAPPAGWWRGDRSAASVLAGHDVHDASAAVIDPGR
jgi:hypothetical protein